MGILYHQIALNDSFNMFVHRERREKYGSSTGISSNRRVDILNLGDDSDYVDSRYHFSGRFVPIK